MEQYLWKDLEKITLSLNPDRPQFLSLARSGNTQAIGDAEQGPVRCALDKLAALIKELIRHPFQVDAGMRAAIDVAVQGVILAYEYGQNLVFSRRDTDAPATVVGNKGQRVTIHLHLAPGWEKPLHAGFLSVDLANNAPI